MTLPSFPGSVSPPAAPNGRYKSEEYYAITRLRYGWCVRLVRHGRRLEKMFTDRAHGGKSAALFHAREWRDRLVREHPPTSRQERAMRPRAGSGPVPGVTCERDGDGRVRLWRAKTHVGPGKLLQKTFSVARYGSRAIDLAILERQKQLGLLLGPSWVHPVEPKVRAAAPRAQPLPPLPERLPANKVARSTNTSGYPGVVRRGRYWTAQTKAGGKWISQSFRIDLHGEGVALVLAVWARLDQLNSQREAPRREAGPAGP